MMRAVLVLLGLIAVANAAAPSTTIDTGVVVGKYAPGLQNQTIVYQGIPFAAPPVGPLRWQSPQPIKTAWTTPYDATYFRPACPQHSVTFAEIDEDCLYLNVYAPTNPVTDKLPVMIWFYGGTWNSGASSLPVYEPQNVIQRTKNVVWVTVNYRLNVLGFLGSEQLRALSPDKSTGNFGIQDQRASMEWVKRNAAAFGGDPDNVMIFGQSAGAGSTSAHLVLPRSKGLFHKAVAESGPWAKWDTVDIEYAQCVFDAVAARVGCAAGADQVKCLQAVPWKTLETEGQGDQGPCEKLKSGHTSFGVAKWAPVIDGVEFTNTTIGMAQQGIINKVPIMIGSNADEATIFFPPPNSGLSWDCTMTQLTGWLNEMMPSDKYPGVVDAALKLYPESDFPPLDGKSTYARIGVHLTSDVMFSCPARRMVRIMSEAGPTAHLYFWEYVPEVVRIFDPKVAACHAIEIPFVYDIFEVLIGKGEQKLAETMGNYWTNFAGTSDPNTPFASANTKPSMMWPTYNASTDLDMSFNIPSIVETALKKPRCDLWDQVFFS